MNSRKLIFTALVLVTLTLSACGPSATQPAAPTQPPATSAPQQPITMEPSPTTEPQPTATAKPAPTEAPTEEAACSTEGVDLRIVYPGRLGPSVPVAVEATQAKYPGLNFTLSDTSSTYTDALQQVVADTAGGLKPDVVMASLAQVSFYVDNFAARPIDDSILSDTYTDRYLVAGTVDGELYAVPLQISIPLIIWNKAIFEQAGLDPESPPTTMTEMESYARQIHENVPDVTPTFLPTSIVYDWIFQNMIQSAGGRVADENNRPAFNSEAGVEALTPWYVLNQDGLGLGIAGLDGFGAFHEGQVGMAFSANSQIGSHTNAIGDKFEWGAAPMPVPENGSPRFAAGGNAWVVLSEDDCRAQFASEFIAASVTPETQAEFAQVTGYIPVDDQARELLADFYDENPNFAVGPNYTGELTPWVAFRGERAFEASETFRTMLESVASGTEPSEALATAEQEILAILGSE